MAAGILSSHREQLEGVGEVELWLTDAATLPFELQGSPVAKASSAAAVRLDVFHHLPDKSPAAGAGPLRRFLRWVGRG